MLHISGAFNSITLHRLEMIPYAFSTLTAGNLVRMGSSMSSPTTTTKSFVNFRRRAKLTHFLRIPLLNQTSSAQVQKTVFEVARDPVSATVPSLAYRPLQGLCLSIATLSLPTQEKEEQAIALFQDLGHCEWQKMFSKAQAARSVARSSLSSEDINNGNVNQSDPQPLIVHLIGLGESIYRRTPSDLDNCMALYTSTKDPTGLLDPFCKALALEFRDAGLERLHPSQRERKDFCFGQTRIIETTFLKSEIPILKPPLREFKLNKATRFDARPLYEKFKDVVWAQNVHLDRVCISKIGPEEVFEEGQRIGLRYHDIASIPLPGVTWEPRSFERLEIPHQLSTTAENPESSQA